MRSRILLVLITCLAALCVQPAFADTLFVTFDLPTQTGSPGDILTFSGTIANHSGADIFVNGAQINLVGFGPGDSELTDFIINFTGLLPDTGSIGPADFFTLTIPDLINAGLYAGTLVIQGGADDAADSTLATVDFSVNVTAASGVPEPATSGLTVGVLCVFLFLKTRSALKPIT
jgi:hypothetical protein